MTFSENLFDNICNDLNQQGFSIQSHSISEKLAQALYQRITSLEASQLKKAGIGREKNYLQQATIRRDKIHWIEGETAAEKEWLNWLETLQTHINRRLFLGLYSNESHFAIYQPGDFYKKHLDAFQGKSNRKLSVVTYLNPDWGVDSGGELVLFESTEKNAAWQDSAVLEKIAPEFGSTVVFLSEDFPHEVLPTQQLRYSIASWFRINQC